MSRPNFARLGIIDQQPAYFEKMFVLYDHAKTDLGLYNPKDRLWWRDVKFKPPFTTRMETVLLVARQRVGFGGLGQSFGRASRHQPHRAEYVRMFEDMSAALRPLQRQDGFWNVNLGDRKDFGGPETTGTALFVYGMAWASITVTCQRRLTFPRSSKDGRR